LKRADPAHQVPVLEPGLDRHDWETEFQALEEELHAAPAEALPELANLVERMLEERGFAVGDPVASDGVEPEVLAEYRSARETATRLDRDEDVDPGDVGAAINGLIAVYQHVLSERSAP
jgi:hypothetical protein